MDSKFSTFDNEELSMIMFQMEEASHAIMCNGIYERGEKLIHKRLKEDAQSEIDRRKANNTWQYV